MKLKCARCGITRDKKNGLYHYEGGEPNALCSIRGHDYQPGEDVRMKKFQRFGNTFVAQDNDGTLYVVSYYCQAWQPYYRTPDMEKPEMIGKYGYGRPEDAMEAVEEYCLG